MTAEELDILLFFRRFLVGPKEMLFFTPSDCKVAAKHFIAAMHSLMEKDLVVKERPAQAYSLTNAGYRLSLKAPPKRPAARSKK
jgi:hypothetical protein